MALMCLGRVVQESQVWSLGEIWAGQGAERHQEICRNLRSQWGVDETCPHIPRECVPGGREGPGLEEPPRIFLLEDRQKKKGLRKHSWWDQRELRGLGRRGFLKTRSALGDNQGMHQQI